MTSFLRKYIPFTKAQIQEFIAYRAHAIIWILMEFFYLLLQYFIWKAVFLNSATNIIKGFTFTQMLIYIFLIRIVSSLTFVMPSSYISDDVRSGSIAMMLIKPISYRTQLFFRSLGESVNSIIFFVIPLTIAAFITSFFVNLNIYIDFMTISFFVISLLFAFLIRFFIDYIFGLIIFLTINSFGIFQLRRAIESIFSGMIIPIIFFPPVLLTIAKILPFMQGLYVPVRVFMGEYETLFDLLKAVGFQLGWIVLLLVLSNIMWNRVIRKLVIMGG